MKPLGLLFAVGMQVCACSVVDLNTREREYPDAATAIAHEASDNVPLRDVLLPCASEVHVRSNFDTGEMWVRFRCPNYPIANWMTPSDAPAVDSVIGRRSAARLRSSGWWPTSDVEKKVNYYQGSWVATAGSGARLSGAALIAIDASNSLVYYIHGHREWGAISN